MKRKFFVLLGLLLLFCGSGYSQDPEWHHYISPPSNLTPIQLEVTDDGTLFLLTAQKEIYYREIDQSLWIKVEGVFGWWNHDNIGVNPETNRLFVGTSGHGIRYTDDYGENWGLEYFYTLPTSGFHASIHSIAVSGNNDMVILGSGYNPTNNEVKVYRSFNDGNSWISSPAPDSFCKLFFSSTGNILGATFSQGVFRSTNNGTNWNFLSLPGDQVVDFAEDNEGNIYAAVNSTFDSSLPGLFVSSDDGESWSILNEGLEVTAPLCVLFDSLNERLLCGTEEGVFELIDGQWLDISANLNSDPVNDIINFDEKIYSGARFYGVHEQPNMMNWEGFNEGIKGGLADFIFNEEEHLYGCDDATLSLNVDPELPWENFHLNDISSNFNRFEKLEKNSEGDIFALDFNEFYKSTDGGVSFENITPVIPLAPFGNYLSFADIFIGKNDEILLYQQLDDRLYHSTDNGNTFQVLVSVDEIPEFMQLLEFVVTEDGRYYIYVIYFGVEEKLYTSADGTNWINIDLEPVFQNGAGVGEDLHVLENDKVIFSINHQPYFISEIDNSFEIIDVPWTYENPNAFYDVYSNEQNHLFINQFATFGNLESEGIWKSTDMGESWTNIGFPQDLDASTLYGGEIKMGPQGLPFILAGNSSTELAGLFYFGQEDVFVGIEEFNSGDEKVLIYPNPAKNDRRLTIVVSPMISIDYVTVSDVKGNAIQVNTTVNHNGLELLMSNLSAGIYIVNSFSNGALIARNKVVLH